MKLAEILDAPMDLAEEARAFEATRKEREALAPRDLWRLNLDLGGAVGTVLAAVVGIARVAPEVERIRGIGRGGLQRVRTLALAAWHAQGLWLDAKATGALVDRAYRARTDVYAEASAVRRRLLDLARLVTRPDWKLVDAADLERLDLQGTRAGLAQDLYRLRGFFRAHWDVLEGKTPLSSKELEALSNLAKEVTRARGVPDAPAAPTSHPLHDVRRRAFTLLAVAYQRLRAALEYVRTEQGDAARLAPALYAGPGSRKRRAATPEGARASKTAKAVKAMAVKAPEEPKALKETAPARLAAPDARVAADPAEGPRALALAAPRGGTIIDVGAGGTASVEPHAAVPSGRTSGASLDASLVEPRGGPPGGTPAASAVRLTLEVTREAAPPSLLDGLRRMAIALVQVTGAPSG